MKPNGFLAALVGFLACAVIVLSAVLLWSVREQGRIETLLTDIERQLDSDKQEWNKIRQTALSAFPIEKTDWDARGVVDEQIDSATKELRQLITEVSRNATLSQIDQAKKWDLLDKKLASLSKHLQSAEIKWIYFQSSSLGGEPVPE